MRIDWFPILFDAQLVVIVATLVFWACYDKIMVFIRRVFRRNRRRKAWIRCTDGKIVGAKPIPSMTAEEVIAICRDI